MLAHLYFTQALAAERQEELERAAARRFVPTEPERPRPPEPQVTIRLATCRDLDALARLGALAEQAVPVDEDVLVAEVGGELRAALPLSATEAIRDPFHATADLASLLSLRAAQLRPRPTRLRGLRRALGAAV